jgi:transposase
VNIELDDKWFRPAAYYLVKVKGMKQKEVAKLFDVSERRVSNLMKRFRETGTHKDRAGKGKEDGAKRAESPGGT